MDQRKEDHSIRRMKLDGQFPTTGTGPDGGALIGSSSHSTVVRYFDFDEPNHCLDDLVGEHSCGNHRADADWYYGVTIAVDPGYRRLGIGKGLYALRKEVVRRLGKAGIVAGGVIPGYADHIDAMTADEYVDEVKAGDS